MSNSAKKMRRVPLVYGLPWQPPAAHHNKQRQLLQYQWRSFDFGGHHHLNCSPTRLTCESRARHLVQCSDLPNQPASSVPGWNLTEASAGGHQAWRATPRRWWRNLGLHGTTGSLKEREPGDLASGRWLPRWGGHLPSPWTTPPLEQPFVFLFVLKNKWTFINLNSKNSEQMNI